MTSSMGLPWLSARTVSAQLSEYQLNPCVPENTTTCLSSGCTRMRRTTPMSSSGESCSSDALRLNSSCMLDYVFPLS